ncbi:MAG: nucleotidyltransferase domain-containing protein [Eubacteriales bacterium]
MFRLETYMEDLISSLLNTYEERLLYVGLQGSYHRNEADANSDIDIMVVLNDISIQDMDVYRNILTAIGNFDKSCGFICGKSELVHWNPMEICHLLHTTKDYYGKLEDYVPVYTHEDEKNFVKLSLNNLFHELCHRYIHTSEENNKAKLPLTYKTVFFIIQNIYYLNTGIFISTKNELLDCIDKEDKDVLTKAIELKNAVNYDFEKSFVLLFEWCKKAMSRI